MIRVHTVSTFLFLLITATTLQGCGILTPTGGTPVEQATYDSFTPGRTTQIDVRRAIGVSPFKTRYVQTGQIDIYGTSHYSGKNYIPGYFGDAETCVVWSFEYNNENILTRKWVSSDCSVAK